jgi:hypothetical protein
MKKVELLKKCEEMGIKGMGAKTKNEIILEIDKREKTAKNINPSKFLSDFNTVLKELIIKTKKDKNRSVCKNCNELGHGISSVYCKLNILKNEKLRSKIKEYILSQNCLEDKSIDDYIIGLSLSLNITQNLCKSLYNEIPLDELLDRQLNIDTYLKNIKKLSKKCNECNKTIIQIEKNTHRVWNGNNICDNCWHKYEDCRNVIWDKIKKYIITKCEICSSIQSCHSERYHFDHLNMFNKNMSISCMVKQGIDIDLIYKEIDKCHILCLSCHHIVTDIERKMGFTRIKNILTRNLKQSKITEEEYNKQTIYYQNIYEDKIKNVYEKMKILQYKSI